MKIMQTIKRIAEYIIDKILIKAGHGLFAMDYLLLSQ
jgi:hypothetical protein